MGCRRVLSGNAELRGRLVNARINLHGDVAGINRARSAPTRGDDGAVLVHCSATINRLAPALAVPRSRPQTAQTVKLTAVPRSPELVPLVCGVVLVALVVFTAAARAAEVVTLLAALAAGDVAAFVVDPIVPVALVDPVVVPVWVPVCAAAAFVPVLRERFR